MDTSDDQLVGESINDKKVLYNHNEDRSVIYEYEPSEYEEERILRIYMYLLKEMVA